MLFQYEINNLQDWGKVFQDKSAFEPLVKQIFSENNLEYVGIENCTPGSNAVFRAGNYIVKIFAPEESEIGGESDFLTERYGISRANELGIAAPKLYDSGTIHDKYIFRYLILEYIEGVSLGDISEELSREDRIKIGEKLREMVDKMDTPCLKFNEHVLLGEMAEGRWKIFPISFQEERKEFLRKQEKKENVYIHGDLNPDNIILNRKHEIIVIDFADALVGPLEVELAAVICDGFRFDRDYLKGYLGEYDAEKVSAELLYGLMMHDYGANIIRDNIGNPEMIFDLKTLKKLILKKL